MKDVPLCLRHTRHVEWQLQLLGLSLDEFEGNVLELLNYERAGTIGRALSAEARLAREKLHQAREAWVAGKLKIMELDLASARARFDSLSRTAHESADVTSRLWQLQRRIAELETMIRLAKKGNRFHPDTGSDPAL